MMGFLIKNARLGKGLIFDDEDFRKQLMGSKIQGAMDMMKSRGE